MDIHRRSSCRLLAGVLVAGSLAAGGAHAAGKGGAQPAPAAPAAAQVAPVFDMSPLPVTTGQMTQYILSPAGQLSGMLLADGTQVFFSHDLGEQLPAIARPGEQVSVNGLKGIGRPIVRAYAVTGPRGRRIADVRPPATAPMPVESPSIGPDVPVDGTILAPLYDMQGGVQGVIMRDHSVVYVGEKNASRLVAWLKPGATLHAIGTGVTGDHGTAINAREIGPDVNQAIHVEPADAPPPGAFPGSAGYDVIPGGSSGD
ncbi:hypothetical protein LU298_14550 [Komagataeibacter intermedius]|uniref:Uncharacterized protein n=2 Tax=Komagataeibacter intermedius TaxID=66229 RepID=A0A0N1FIW8_9PROT|nr:hypothetical protein [Komagataeibacter intermedius]KPH85531.1 hypothetical protein GLUCOINTEAF2_0201120 [Komagataeibacter intermedius AF2]MCF3637707.1 hypothetical protein [Komagataeibacter intermedius]GAN86022.1 hypothetical protein Gain_0012_085 [Komagataeibacter intermedius TF2]GBQ72236.1 hypothetical protein AA0521_2057 [Komagataeibacter intermedius NRIC 0521]